MIVVRPFDRSDLEAVIAGLPARASEMHGRRLDDHEHGHSMWFIAWFDGRPIGFVGVGMHNDRDVDEMLEARGYALVEDLHVEEAYRRRGAARALMEALERVARDAGMPGVILDTGVNEYFAPARALYASLGYVDQGGVYLGGWSDPDRPGVNLVDQLTMWIKPF
ncbi:MAG TPA: GNAT family N-acetyltransferase [Actinomycetota bacterium]|nr:GNAT family N-acetyltransferase [Actinomycetota bacterium]